MSRNRHYRNASLRCRRVAAALLVALLGTAIALPSVALGATREQAIAQALAADGNRGRVLGVQREQGRDGREVYSVKVITDGRVRVHRFPADR